MSDKFTSEFLTITQTQCKECKHRDTEDLFRCLAFPHGIPSDILQNKVSHKLPYKGDHGFRFTQKEVA